MGGEAGVHDKNQKVGYMKRRKKICRSWEGRKREGGCEKAVRIYSPSCLSNGSSLVGRYVQLAGPRSVG